MAEKTFYPVVEASPDFSKMEEQVLDSWRKEAVFEASVAKRPAKTALGENNEFIFYDGPPFANGLPHYGHLLTSCVKDLFARYQTMKKKRVERRFGWDCHGLPAEMQSEKELGVSGRAQIENFGIEKFNAHCRSSVMRYTEEWQSYITRAARWVDFGNDYKTMDITYMESVLWAFKQLYSKGLMYESYRVMPYSWACETPLSNFETRLDNAYRERADNAVTVAFTLKDTPKGAPAGTYKILAWTTTPWTLPSNLAVAVGEKVVYAAVKKDGANYIIAKSSLPLYKKELGEQPEIVAEFTGNELKELTYQPLFPYFANHANSFRVLVGEFVEEGSGTGIVHMAPGFGEDDQILCAKNGIELVCPVDSAGKFTSEVPDYQGLQVFDANVPIIKRLKEEGSWLKTEQILHSYPHCWRTDQPLIYKAVPSWYVEVTKFRDRMVELNQNINWIPGHVKDGLFGKWLENARDWSISRNRYWGTPIPVWKSNDPKYPRIDVYGSIAELEADFGVKVTDLHRPFIDNLTRKNPDDPTGKSMMVRVTDVFDCWFESGSMPFAQVHYPFENKDWFETHFPADFIVEYTAQTRGWFYTLMVLGTALFDSHPFKNCICHGVILDTNGQKLSKRLNNYADPKDVFNQYGADALRWLMISAPVMQGGELLIDKECNDVRDTIRLVLKPVWNAYNFFTLYANADGVLASFNTSSINVMDRYILAKARQAVSAIEKALDAYDTPAATRAVENFFEVLNNWYIRRSRPRFWKKEKDDDKQAAYDTLYSVLTLLMRASAPLLPLLSEQVYAGLVGNAPFKKEKSIHLSTFPDVSAIGEEPELVEAMDRVRDACNAALSIRNAENIRTRQPLASLTLYGTGITALEPFKDVIGDELNVKQVVLSETLDAVASFKLQVNFPVVGKRLGAKMKDITVAVKSGNWKRGAAGIEAAGETLVDGEYTLLLEAKEKKGTAPLSTNDALVVLDLNVTPELKAEGLARDVVRMVQQARKDANLNVSDRIALSVDASGELADAVTSHKGFIEEQTLAELSVGKNSGSFSADGTIEGHAISLSLSVSKAHAA